MDHPSIAPGPDGQPPLGLVIGPHPPCTTCGSDGYPADLEVSFKGRDAWLCIDCYLTHMPAPIIAAHPADRLKIMRLRATPWSRSWRGWKKRSRDEAETPTLTLP